MTHAISQRIAAPCAVSLVSPPSEGVRKLEAALCPHGIELLRADTAQRALLLMRDRVPVILALDGNRDWCKYTMKLILRAHVYAPAVRILVISDGEQAMEPSLGSIALRLLDSTASQESYGQVVLDLLVNYEADRHGLRRRSEPTRPDLVDYLEYWLVAWVAERHETEPERVDRRAPVSSILTDPREREDLAAACDEVMGSTTERELLETALSLRDLAQALVSALEKREGQT